MGLDLTYLAGQSPIDEDEKEGLILKTITNRNELNEFEQYNIEKALEWTLRNKFSLDRIVNEDFIQELHKRMFDEVWNWAGQYRITNKNIGVDKSLIRNELKKLLDDSAFWIEQKTYRYDEISIRFKHRLVQIHLFPNGNGRHARLFADVMISHGFNKPVFSWGGVDLSMSGETRQQYLEAIYEADKANILPLIEFARS